MLAFALVQFPHHTQSHDFGPAHGPGGNVPSLSLHADGAADPHADDFHPNQSGEHDAQCGISLACVSTGWVRSDAAAVAAPVVHHYDFVQVAAKPLRSVAPGLEPRPPRQFS